MKRFLFPILTFLLAGPLAVGSGLAAESYPTKPITLVVPIGAGGMTDVTARRLAEKFKVELGQPVLVLNKPGASGSLGLKYLLSQKADGYTAVVAPLIAAYALAARLRACLNFLIGLVQEEN